MQPETRHIPPALGISKLLTKKGDVPKTIADMQRIVKRDYMDVYRLAKSLEADTIYNTCQNVWRFVRATIKYELDHNDNGDEVLRTPKRTWADRAGDCDCMTIFISAVLYALNIPHAYKVISQEVKGEFTHIYPIVFIDEVDYIVIDCVPEISKFNQEAKYIIDFEIYHINMKTYELGNLNPAIFELAKMYGDEVDTEAIKENPIDSALAMSKDVIEKIETDIKARDYIMSQEARGELEIIANIKTAFGEDDMFFSAIEEAYAKSMYFKDAYEQLLQTIESALSPSAMSGLGFFDNIISGIGNAVSQVATGVDKLFGGEKKRLEVQANAAKDTAAQQTRQAELMLQAQQEARRAEEAKAKAEETKRQSELQQQTMLMQQQRSLTKEEEIKKEEKSWFAKNWIWLVAGTGGLILIVVVIYFLTKKKKTLKGVRRRRKAVKPVVVRRRRRAVSGTSTTTMQGLRRAAVRKPVRRKIRKTAKRKVKVRRKK